MLFWQLAWPVSGQFSIHHLLISKHFLFLCLQQLFGCEKIVKRGLLWSSAVGTKPHIPSFPLANQWVKPQEESMRPRTPEAHISTFVIMIRQWWPPDNIYKRQPWAHIEKVKPLPSIASQIYYVLLKVSSKVQESCEEILPKFMPEHISYQKYVYTTSLSGRSVF